MRVKCHVDLAFIVYATDLVTGKAVGDLNSNREAC